MKDPWAATPRFVAPAADRRARLAAVRSQAFGAQAGPEALRRAPKTFNSSPSRSRLAPPKAPGPKSTLLNSEPVAGCGKDHAGHRRILPHANIDKPASAAAKTILYPGFSLEMSGENALPSFTGATWKGASRLITPSDRGEKLYPHNRQRRNSETVSWDPFCEGAIHEGLVFEYRDTRLEFEADFVSAYSADYVEWRSRVMDPDDTGQEHIAYGLVSSVQSTLADLWEILQHDLGDFDTFHELLGRYNLPRGGDDFLSRFLFWPYGWGAPKRVYLWICQAIWAFRGQADYMYAPKTFIYDGADECDGIAGFLSKLLVALQSTTRSLLHLG